MLLLQFYMQILLILSSSATDDPISSTSDALQEKKLKSEEMDMDLFELNVPAAQTGKIVEDVDDIAQDLENLLDQPGDYQTSSHKASEDLDVESELNDLLGTTSECLACPL